LEVLSWTAADLGAHRLNVVLPISLQSDFGTTRVYGSTGYFSRGSLFGAGAAEWTVGSRGTLVASLSHSYSVKSDPLADARGEQGDPAELPPAQKPDGNFTACHILYTSVRREPAGAGWRTDYPWGERHLLMRLAELTKTRVSLVTGGKTPHAWLVRLTDDAL